MDAGKQTRGGTSGVQGWLRLREPQCRAAVRSLVWEQRSHMLCGRASLKRHQVLSQRPRTLLVTASRPKTLRCLPSRPRLRQGEYARELIRETCGSRVVVNRERNTGLQGPAAFLADRRKFSAPLAGAFLCFCQLSLAHDPWEATREGEVSSLSGLPGRLCTGLSGDFPSVAPSSLVLALVAPFGKSGNLTATSPRPAI